MFGAPGANKSNILFSAKHKMAPLVIQELSGSTLFKLNSEVLDLETIGLWQTTNIVVLKDLIRFNRDGEVVFFNKENLESGETYIGLLKKVRHRYNFKFLVEMQDYFLQGEYACWENSLSSLFRFCTLHKLDGVKFCLSEDLVLTREIVWAVEKFVGSVRPGDNLAKSFTILEFRDSLLKYRGFINRLINLCDYTLFPMQGHIDYAYEGTIYGHKHRKVIDNSDRDVLLCEARLHYWVGMGCPRGKLIANFATTGLVMEKEPIADHVVKMYEVRRSEIYRKLNNDVGESIYEWSRGYERKIFYDSHNKIIQKLQVFLGKHLLAGVCIQDLDNDMLWLDPRSVFGCVKSFIHVASGGIDDGERERGSFDTTEILQVQRIAPASLSTSSTGISLDSLSL